MKKQFVILKKQDRIDSDPYYCIGIKKRVPALFRLFTKKQFYVRTFYFKLYKHLVCSRYGFEKSYKLHNHKEHAIQFKEQLEHFFSLKRFKYKGYTFIPCLYKFQHTGIKIGYYRRFGENYYGTYDYSRDIFTSTDECKEEANRLRFKPTSKVDEL